MLLSTGPNRPTVLQGYLNPAYPAALGEFGTPRQLPGSGGWIIRRPIPGTEDRYDAMGSYPLFNCQDWSKLGRDLALLKEEGLVSLQLITDPFGEFNLTDLRQNFDIVRFWKDYLVADLAEPLERIVSRHHRYYARRAFKSIQVESSTAPLDWLDDWHTLYNHLIERHHLTGIKAFSRQSFAHQLAVPGIVAFRAVARGATVGMLLTYVRGEVAYCHLTASTGEGYRLGAAYTTYFSAVQYFKDKVRWLVLGGAAGGAPVAASSLVDFKRGWTNTARPTYLCGKIFDPARYAELAGARGLSESAYFPAYRSGEF